MHTETQHIGLRRFVIDSGIVISGLIVAVGGFLTHEMNWLLASV